MTDRSASGRCPESSLSPPGTLSFTILGQRIRVACTDATLRNILTANFGAMAAADDGVPVHLEYRVESRAAPSSGIALTRTGGDAAIFTDTAGDFLFALEKDITVELQKRRADLYFLHSAAVAWDDGCFLLAAESGNGKSTTTWGLLHHGFEYLSDELSPIDLGSMMVHPYPHALCLKRQPPADYSLPDGIVDLGRTIHVPVQSLPSAFVARPLPLRGVLLVSHSPAPCAPSMHAISSAEAAARLYVVALNALAHANHGLDASVRIAEHVPCFAVSTGELSASCAMIRAALERIGAGVVTEEGYRRS